MSYHDYALSQYRHAHRHVTRRLRLVEQVKLTAEPQLAGTHTVDLYRFMMEWAETGKSFAMVIPYDWDLGEWVMDSASCGTEWPIELRAEGVALASRASPFACPTVSA